MIILNDVKVSRMIAEEAIHDQAFRDLLSDFASTGNVQTRGKKFQAMDRTITEFRKQIADEAGLKAPKDGSGFERSLSTYLKQVTHSRVLVGKASAQEEQGAKLTSEEGNHAWGWVGNPVCVARLALSFLQSTLRLQADASPFPFEQLPPELRRQVYREALKGPACNGVACGGRIKVFYNKNGNFQYQLDGHQKGNSKEININLLATNRLVNHEAIHVLYQLYTFDFTKHVGGIVPFLRSLSEETRQNLHGIAMELRDKRQHDHCCGGFDNAWGTGPDNQAAWSIACSYIAANVKVKELSLTINVKVPMNFESLQWVKALVTIKGLKCLTLQARQHLNDPVLTRASYKDGSLAATRSCFSEHLVDLFEYLRKEMLE